jgi:hypothetical protein
MNLNNQQQQQPGSSSEPTTKIKHVIMRQEGEYILSQDAITTSLGTELTSRDRRDDRELHESEGNGNQASNSRSSTGGGRGDREGGPNRNNQTKLGTRLIAKINGRVLGHRRDQLDEICRSTKRKKNRGNRPPCPFIGSGVARVAHSDRVAHHKYFAPNTISLLLHFLIIPMKFSSKGGCESLLRGP